MRGSLRRFMRGLCGEVREASIDRCGEEVYAGGLCGGLCGAFFGDVYAEAYAVINCLLINYIKYSK